MTIEERERALSLIPRLIGFILLHMELCPEFRPREGAHCRWVFLAERVYHIFPTIDSGIRSREAFLFPLASPITP